MLSEIFDNVFFNGWIPIFEVMLTALIVYTMLVILLRVSGKRTLSKMNMFDFIVTIAQGSILAGTIINKDISIIEGFMGAVMLVLLQYMVTFSTVRWKGFSDVIVSEPRLVFYNGQFLESDLKKERFTHNEILSVIRAAGILNLDDVHAVVIENNGVPSVIPKADDVNQSSLTDVTNYPTVSENRSAS